MVVEQFYIGLHDKRLFTILIDYAPLLRPDHRLAWIW
jgi:hypothetical protein